MLACCVITVALVGAAIIIFTWFYRPELLIQYGNSLLLLLLGFKTKHLVVCKERRWSYVERGVAEEGKPSLLLIHGFTGDKESWIPMISYIPKNYCHIVALDMLGHGDSDLPPADMPITRDTSVQMLHEFITLTGLARTPIHLVGISMGGLISGMYARSHPENVSLLTLMCPGMISPMRTKFLQDFLKGKCALLANNVEALYTALTMVSSKLNSLKPENDQFLNGMLMIRMKYEAFHRQLYKESLATGGGDGEDADLRALETKGHEIPVPTQVIWGKDDKLLHVTGADTLKSVIPNCCQVDLLDKCGHMIPIDQPRRTVNCLIAFRQMAG